jgi:hypothetical protein
MYRLEHLATKSEPCVLEVGGTLPHLPHTKRHTSVVLSAAPGGHGAIVTVLLLASDGGIRHASG